MTSVAQTRFGIVGSGWRSEFFLRLARLLPERFRVTGRGDAYRVARAPR